MKLQKAPSSISKTVKFPASVTSYLRSEDGQHEHFQSLKGGLLKDTQYAWLSYGPNFEVIRTSNGAKVAAWTFGAVLRDFNTRVTCVCELPSNDGSGRVSQFAVGLDCKFVGGFVCVFDIRGSKVLRAVQVPSKVTSMSVVDSGTGGCYPLPQIVNSMTGILAVGLAGGDVLLLDLCRVNYDEGVGTLPSSELRDELWPCQILSVSVKETGQDSLENKRVNAARTGDHLAVVLNESYLLDKTFALTLPDGKTFNFPKHRVDVTALMYIPRIASVVVGFSFGSFQIWNLMNLTLEYISPILSNPLPVVSFGFQEPSDDPRNYCYLWAVHSNGSSQRQRLPFAVMYALQYQNKELVDGYGYLYQEFVECKHQFEFDLDSEDSGTAIVGGRSITCSTINKVSPVAAKRDNPRGVLDESIQENDLSLALFVWETWGATCPGSSQMALFDLNQWYKDQMPSRIMKGEASTYMTLYSLDDVVEGSFHATNPLLDVRLDPASISQFTAVQSLEEHYYPSALSFESLSLLGEELVVMNHPGVQRDILSQLEQSGPSALLHPTKLFHHCNAVGLKPVYTEVASTINCPVAEQREFLLSVALEYQLIGFLSRCASEWMDGSQSVMGCTLQGLLKWGWQRATTLKAHADNLCIPLYDYSGVKLDSQSYQLLDYCGNQLHHLTTLFQGVLKVCKNPNVRGIGDLEEQAQVLELVAVYIEVVEWFINVGLLPESSCNELSFTNENFLAQEISEPRRIPYPAAILTKSYKNRRENLERLSRSAADKTDILFIDGLVKRECNGDRLSSLWERDGGTGLYPPPSIQSLLRTYLLDGIPLHVKHCIVIYVFMDLTSLLDSRKYDSTVDQFVKFPAAFRLTPSFIKITQALWLLDHEDFAEAIDVLLDPLVSMDDLKPWQHQCIVRAFLYQGQHQMALKYIRVQQPPLKDIEDIRLNLTVLLVNGLIHEAFQYQRQHCNEQNSKDLLQHFFSACQQMNQLSVVLQLALSPSEEEEFTQFLQNCQNPRADDMRVMYYLERSRVAEAMEVNDSIRSSRSHIEPGTCLKRSRTDDKPSSVRDTIVQAYANTLPSVTRKLAQYCAQERSRFFSWKQVSRPTPMSVAVHRGDMQPVRYRSSLIQATLEKARETWSQVMPSPSPLNTPTKRERSSTEKSFVEMTPFLCTPRAGSEAVGFDRDITAVVFPILTNPSPKSDDESLDGSPMKRFRSSEHYPLSHRKKLDRYATVDAQSLLQTPHVRRKNFSLSLQEDITPNASAVAGVGVFTPHSILKIRKFVQQSSTPDNASELSIPTFIPTATTPDLEEKDEEHMQVSDEEPPSSRQIRFTLPSEERSSTPESDEESDSLTRSTARRSIAAVTPRKGLLRKSRLVSTTLSKTFSEEKSVTITNMDAGSTWVTHDEEEYKDKETRSSFYLTEQSQEVTVTPELEEVTGPVTRSASKRSIVGGTPRKALSRTSRLASVTFKSSSSGESNKIVSSQDANLSSTSHDTTKPLEEETESASVENDSDPFYSLENSATGMSENIESPLKKQKVSSSDRDKMEEQPVTGEKPAVDYVEKDNNTDVKEKFVSVETTIKTTEITLPGTDDIEGDMDDVQEVDSSLTEKSQGGILGDWSSFEVSYGENAMDNSTGVIEENENVPEVAASSVEVSFTSLNKCEVQRQEPTYDASERTSTVEPSDMQQTIEEEYVDRREEGDTSGSTCQQIVVENNYQMAEMVHDTNVDLLEAVVNQDEDLEGNDSKTEDASSPEIIQEEKMSHGILIDTSTCSLYFENSTEEVDESQTENQAENFPTLIIESVCGNEGISPSSEDDQKDFQTLQPMAMMPVEELNVDNEMEVSPDLPDVLLASDVESKDINQKLDFIDSQYTHNDLEEIEEENDEDLEDEEYTDEDEEDFSNDEDFDFVRQRVERRKSNDDESIILLDSEDDIVEQPKLVELETKMSDPEESEGENTDMDEEGNEEEEDVKYVSELKKSPQKECAPEDEQKELSVSMTDNDDSVAVRDAVEANNAHIAGITEEKSMTSSEGIVSEKDKDVKSVTDDCGKDNEARDKDVDSDNDDNSGDNDNEARDKIVSSDNDDIGDVDNDNEARVNIQAINTSDEEIECSKNVLVNVSVELPNSSDEEDVQVKESVSKIEIVEIFEKVDVEITQAKDKAEETIKTKDSDSSVVETNTDETNNSCVTNSNKCDVQKRDKMDSDRLDLNKDIPENLANEEMDFEACISFSEISKTGSSLLKTGENLTQSMDVDNDVMDFESEIATNQISKSKLAEVSHKEISVTESGEARNTVSGSVSHFVGEESMEVQQSINETLKDTKDKADKSSSLAENTGEMTNVRAGSVPPVEVPCKNEFNVERNIFRGRSAPPEDVSPTKRKIRKSRYEVESVVEQRDVILNLNTKLASTKAVDKDKYSSQDIKACDKAEQIKRSRLDVTGEETGTKETRCDFNILYKQDSREDLQASQTRAGSLPPENVSKPKLRRSRRSSSVQPEDLMIERVAYGTEDLQRKDTVEKKAKKTNRKAMNEGDKTENIATVDGAVQPQDIVVNKIENQTHEVMGRDEIERKQNISSKEIKDQNPAEVSTSVPSEDVLLEVTCTKSLKSGSRANSVPIVDQPVDDTEGTPKPGKKQHFIACENLPADETKKETHKPGRRSCSVPPKDPHISEVGKRAYECERKGTSIPPDNYSMSDTGRQQSSKDSVAHENLPETKKRTSKSRRRAYSLPSVACYKSDQGIDDSRPLDFVEIEPTKSRNASTSRQSSKPGCSSELTEPVRGNEGHIDDIPHKLSSTANTGAHEVTSDIVESDGERPPSVSSQASTIHLEHSRTTRSRRSSVSSQCSSSQDEGMEVEASKVRSTRSRRSGFVQRDAKLHVVYEEPEETHSAVNKMDIVVGSEKNSQGTRGRRVSESRAGDSEVIHEQGNRTRSEAGSEHSLQIQRNRGSVSEAGSVSEVSVVRTLRSGKVYSESEEDTRSPKSGRFVARQRVRADSTSGGDTVSSQQVMEEYATARRLTRYQKLLLERSMEHATPPASQPTSSSYGRLPALSETSDDEELETSSVGTRSSSRLSAQRVAAVGTSPESSQTSTLQGTPQRPQRLTRRSLSRLKDKVTESPGSVKSDASTVYASSVASCPADTSPTSIHSEDILGSRTRRRSFQKAMHTFKSSSEKGYPMCKGNSPGVSDKDSEADSIQSDSNFIRTRSCAVQLSKVLESDLSSPSSFHFSPPTVLPGGGRKEATSLPVPAFVFSPPQKQQPHPKVHRSNVTSQQTRAHTMALRSLHSISEESSPSTSSSSYLTKSSERDTTPIAVKRSKKFKDSPKPSSPSLSKITPLTEEEKRDLAKRVSRRFYCPDTKRMYSAFKQRKVYKLQSNSKSRP